jgi:hypothetical protein
VQVGVGSTTYYAEASNGLCNSFTRTPVTLTILAAPVAVGTNQTVCQDNNPSQTLTLLPLAEPSPGSTRQPVVLL